MTKYSATAFVTVVLVWLLFASTDGEAEQKEPLSEWGKELYSLYCAACHLATPGARKAELARTTSSAAASLSGFSFAFPAALTLVRVPESIGRARSASGKNAEHRDLCGDRLELLERRVSGSC